MWRVLKEGRMCQGLSEMESFWSIDDLFDAIEFSDSWGEAEARVQKRGAK